MHRVPACKSGSMVSHEWKFGVNTYDIHEPTNVAYLLFLHIRTFDKQTVPIAPILVVFWKYALLHVSWPDSGLLQTGAPD